MLILDSKNFSHIIEKYYFLACNASKTLKPQAKKQKSNRIAKISFAIDTQKN